MDLTNYIQSWVKLDNDINIHKNKMKELRSQRNDLTEAIFDYAERNNIQNAVIEISDGKLKFQNTKQISPLNFKFLEKCLLECIQDENILKNIIENIKNKRDVKYSNEIKRSYN